MPEGMCSARPEQPAKNEFRPSFPTLNSFPDHARVPEVEENVAMSELSFPSSRCETPELYRLQATQPTPSAPPWSWRDILSRFQSFHPRTKRHASAADLSLMVLKILFEQCANPGLLIILGTPYA